jgi:hypothetical protein
VDRVYQALPYLLVCFIGEPPAGSVEECFFTGLEADTVVEWTPQAVPIDSAAQGPGYLQVGYRSGDDFVVLKGGNYRWRSFTDYPSPRVYVQLDDEVIFEPSPERRPDAVYTHWGEWPTRF